MDRIVNTLVSQLSAAGIHCRAGFDGNQFPQLEAPMAAVSLEDTQFFPVSPDGLLGEETPGLALTATLRLDIYDEHRHGAQGCLETALKAVSACADLWSRFPWEAVKLEPLRYYPDLDCFRCGASLPVSLLAVGEEAES